MTKAMQLYNGLRRPPDADAAGIGPPRRAPGAHRGFTFTSAGER